MQKLKSAPKDFTTLGVKADIEKKKNSICPKLLINAERNFLKKFDYFSTKKLGNFWNFFFPPNVHSTNSANFFGQNLPNFLYEKFEEKKKEKNIVGHHVQIQSFLIYLHASL